MKMVTKISKGLCHDILVYCFQKAKRCLHVSLIPKIMVWFCYERPSCGTETVSCHLLLRMARMEMVGNGLELEKIGPIFSSFDALCSKITKKNLLRLALPDKIHLISSS